MRPYLRILLYSFIAILVLLGGLITYTQTSSGQAFITQKVTSFLARKFGTKVSAKKISYKIPDWIALDEVFIEDTQHDTLVSGKRLYVDIDMWALLRSEVAINKVEMQDIRAKVKRTLPDTTFNFNQIIQAFASTDTSQVSNTSSSKPLAMNIKQITLSNIHVSYQDNVIGTDAEVILNQFTAKFDALNPVTSVYKINDISLIGSQIDLHTYKPLKEASSSTSSDTLNLQLGHLHLEKVNASFNDQVSGLNSKVNIGVLSAEGETFYLDKQLVKLKNIYLDNSLAQITLKPVKVVKTVVKNTPETASKPWDIRVGKISFKKNSIIFDDNTKPRQTKGLDPAHLKITPFNLEAERFVFAPNDISGWLQNISLNEKSGFRLIKLQTDFAYTNKKAFLKKLTFQTPKSLIQDEVSLSYNSLEQLNKNLGATRVTVNLKQSKLAFEDILLLAPTLATTPPFVGNNKEILRFNGKATGTINRLSIPNFSVEGFNHAKINLNGDIVGLPNINKTSLKVGIKEVSVTKTDLVKMLPPNSLPPDIELPEKVLMKGSINGSVNNLLLNTNIVSNLGEASFKGKLVNITAKTNQQYEGLLTLNNFDLGKLLKKPEQFGKISIESDFKGTGFDPKTMQGQFAGKIKQAVLNGYDYQDVLFEASIAQQIAHINAKLADPNANFSLDSKIDISQEHPAIVGDMLIKELNLKALKLYPDDIALKGDIHINIPQADPNNLNGFVTIDQGFIYQNGKPIPLDDVRLVAQNSSQENSFTITSPFLKADMKGTFNYTQLADIIIGDINRHFTIPDISAKAVTQPYQISIKAVAISHPAIRAFLPQLTRLDSAKFVAELSSTIGHSMSMSLDIPFVEYDTIRAYKINFTAQADSNQLSYTSSLKQLTYSAFKMRNTTLNGIVKNNLATFNLVLKDSVNQEHHRVAGNVANFSNQFRINLLENGLKLNYEPWQIDSSGFIQYGQAGLVVSNFLLQNKEQHLLVNTPEMTPNAPIDITAQKLDLHKMIALVYPDSTIADGTLDGKITLANYMQSPSFTGDITVSGFTFQNTPIGDLVAHVYNESPEKITVNTTLANSQNNISLIGNYMLNAKEPLNFNLKINKLGTETIQAFSFGQLRRAKGSLNGEISVKGAVDKPFLDGFIGFDKVGFDVSQLGSRFLINQQKITFKNHEMLFNNFTLSDTLNQPLKVNGKILFNKLPEVEYDLNTSTKNFMVLNSTRKDNDFFYGKAFVDANIGLKGTTSSVAVEGNVKLIEKSKISVLIPDNTTTEDANSDIVVFVDKNKKITEKDSTLAQNTRFNNNFISEMTLLLEADEKSEMTIIVDEINGDNLKVKGKAQLNVGITPSGQPYILGLYELTEGSYDLSFELLKKQFTIEKGSNILWMGDPMSGKINITAIYQVNTSAADLLNSTETQYRSKIPFEVLLKLDGPMQKIETSFEIRLPEKPAVPIDDNVKTNVNAKLKELNTNTTDLNKQVFALLILNKFFSEKSSDFFSTINPEAIVRQSVSKLLSDQLEKLAGDVIKGVNLSINLNSTQSTFGKESSSRTDLNLGLSKAFFNDKLKVEVGKNFELENTNGIQRNPTEVFDNVRINYNLTDDGRYRFIAYRKNQFQTVLEGFVVETGVSFTITFDYQSINEVFRKKK